MLQTLHSDPSQHSESSSKWQSKPVPWKRWRVLAARCVPHPAPRHRASASSVSRVFWTRRRRPASLRRSECRRRRWSLVLGVEPLLAEVRRHRAVHVELAEPRGAVRRTMPPLPTVGANSLLELLQVAALARPVGVRARGEPRLGPAEVAVALHTCLERLRPKRQTGVRLAGNRQGGAARSRKESESKLA